MNTCSYFSLLSEEILEIIIRQCSECPRHPNWCSYFDTSFAIELLSVRSPLRDSASKLLYKLEISDGVPQLENSLILSSYNNEAFFATCISEFGNNLLELAVSEKPRSSYNRSWMMSVSKYCYRLTSLRISGKVDPASLSHLLASRGNQLNSLSLTVFRPSITFAAIGAWCPALRELELIEVREKCSDLWETIGLSLRKLKLEFAFRAEIISTVHDITFYCRGLKYIDLPAPFGGFPSEEAEAICDMYASFENQLEYINFREANMRHYGKVIEKCSNFKCSTGFNFFLPRLGPWTVRDAEHIELQLDTLGNRVSEIHLFGTPPSTFNLSSRLASRCLSLEKIHGFKLGARNYELFRSLFSTPKSLLRNFKWEPNWPVLDDASAQQEFLSIISSQAKNITEFSVRIDISKLGIFEEFCVVSSKLEIVVISLASGTFFSRFKAEAILADIIKSFSRCMRLRTLVINCEGGMWSTPEIREKSANVFNECGLLRLRGCFVQVCEEVYSP